jgi:hypothetical protein
MRRVNEYGVEFMRCVIAAAAGTGALCLAFWASTGPAAADVLININKSAQQMSVLVDGRLQYTWRISTGLGGGPPSGAYRPQRLERHWRSRKYGWAPMPHSIFFHQGYAIHGTVHVSRLGRRASHGCVRLHPAHAATLFALVRNYGSTQTRIMVGYGGAVAEVTDDGAAAGRVKERSEAAARRKNRADAVAPVKRHGEVVARAKVRPPRAGPLMDLSRW